MTNTLRRIFLLAALLFGLTAGAAYAENRVALVIGNAAYEQVGALENPVRDAKAMTALLEGVGFDVVQGIDLDRSGMQETLKIFSDRLTDADVALFYYAGHGVQVEGENYLIPTDAQIENETDLAFATVPLGLIEEQMSRVPRIKMLLLDACRDNPFKTQLTRGMSASRALTMPDGLAAVDLSDDVGGTFIAFATDPGSYASDGHGTAHAPFTQALLDNMSRPGMELHAMMIDVRAQVWQQTDETQRPWSNSSLTGKFYFNRGEPGTKLVGTTEADLELALWQEVSAGNSKIEYQAYLDRYPHGTFSEVARARLKDEADDGQVVAKADTAIPTAATPSAETPKTEITGTDAPPNTPLRQRRNRQKADATDKNLPPEIAEQTLAMTSEDRREIQAFLDHLGFNPGPETEDFSEQTRVAIRSWQWSEELPATGYLTADQRALIHAHADTVLSAAPSLDKAVYSRSITTTRSEQSGTTKRSRRTRARDRSFRSSGDVDFSPKIVPNRAPPSVQPPEEADLLEQAFDHIGENLRFEFNAPETPPALRSLLRKQRVRNGDR
jgi:peptidoglycan hydrolase-like protein with peptidoglycan-binding domain